MGVRVQAGKRGVIETGDEERGEVVLALAEKYGSWLDATLGAAVSGGVRRGSCGMRWRCREGWFVVGYWVDLDLRGRRGVVFRGPGGRGGWGGSSEPSEH